MKYVVILFFAVLILNTSLLSAAACDLKTTLLNQDPYPAVPGDYVKLVFQVEGFENPECSDITFELVEDYPIRFDPGESGLRTFSQIDYIDDYESNVLIPYEVRVDNEALDGENPIRVRIEEKIRNYLEKFNLEIEDVRADFEIYVREYDYNTNTLTLEILNIEKVDIEALTVTIPQQENIVIKGPFNVIVGDLDSNEYTTADFEATLENGNIAVELTYTDSINVRRKITKDVLFEDSYFLDRIGDEKKSSTGMYFAIAVVILVGIFWYLRRKRRLKAKHKH